MQSGALWPAARSLARSVSRSVKQTDRRTDNNNNNNNNLITLSVRDLWARERGEKKSKKWSRPRARLESGRALVTLAGRRASRGLVRTRAEAEKVAEEDCD